MAEFRNNFCREPTIVNLVKLPNLVEENVAQAVVRWVPVDCLVEVVTQGKTKPRPLLQCLLLFWSQGMFLTTLISLMANTSASF